MNIHSLTFNEINEDVNVLRRLIARKRIDEGVVWPQEIPQNCYILHPITSRTISNTSSLDVEINAVSIYNERVKIILNGIKLYVNVVYPDSWSLQHLNAFMDSPDFKRNVKIIKDRTKIVEGMRVHDHYTYNPVNCVRFEFINFNLRKEAIEYLRTCESQGIYTYNDATGVMTFDRSVFVEYEIPPFDWWVIPHDKAVGNTRNVVVRAEDIKTLKTYNCDKLKYRSLYRVPFANLGWDTETLKRESSDVPLWHQPDANLRIFSYCLSEYEIDPQNLWMAAVHDLRNFDIEDFKQNNLGSIPTKELILISCADEPQMLRIHTLFQTLCEPDCDITFNGGGYDHRWVVERHRMSGTLGEYVRAVDPFVPQWKKDNMLYEDYNKIPAIKISAEEIMKVYWYPFKSFVTIDAMVLLKRSSKGKDEVSSGQSMNYFLKKNGLQAKVDIEHSYMHELFNADLGIPPPEDPIYESLRKGLSLVMEYAIVDAVSPNALMSKTKIFSEVGEISNLTYVSFEDALYRADGMKIFNLISYICKNNGRLLTARDPIKVSKQPFIGAYVYEPIKGLHKYLPREGEMHKGDTTPCVHNETIYKIPMNEYATPVLPFDFASLYPSITNEKNLCTGAKISDARLAARLAAIGLDLNELYFPEDLPNMKYWTINHKGDRSKFGIVPLTLHILVAIRKQLKGYLKVAESTIHELELVQTERLLTANEEEKLSDAERAKSYYDMKQKAVKVMMNSIYGNYGSEYSVLHDYELAATITCIGRFALRKIIDFHISEGSIMIYGDTDSTYIQFGPHVYKDIFERRLEMTREEYCKALVVRAYKYRPEYKKRLDAYIKSIFPNDMIKMEPEGILFPLYMRSKKKYIGIEHEDPMGDLSKVHFDNKKHRLIKGLETKQTGKTSVLYDSHNSIFDQILDINRDISEIEAVNHVLRYLILEHKWELKECAKYVTYKPEKQNVTVRRIYERIRINNPELLPNPYDKFKVIAVQTPFSDMFGCRDEDAMKMGNRYVLLELAQKFNMKIDVIYYASKDVGNSLASYLYYLPLFDPTQFEEDRSAWNKGDYDKLYIRLRNASKTYIRKQSEKYLYETGLSMPLTEMKKYYQVLSTRYSLLKEIQKYKKYFSPSIHHEEGEIAPSTIANLRKEFSAFFEKSLPDEYEMGIISEMAIAAGSNFKDISEGMRIELNDIITHMIDIVAEAQAELEEISDFILEHRDKLKTPPDQIIMSPELRTVNIVNFIIWIKTGLRIVKQIKDLSKAFSNAHL